MVKKMNKTGFVDELAKQLKYSKAKCEVINEILENNFFISRQSKDKIITELKQRLEIDEKEADKVYNTAVEIINDEIRYKLRHPFRSKD